MPAGLKTGLAVLAMFALAACQMTTDTARTVDPDYEPELICGNC